MTESQEQFLKQIAGGLNTARTDIRSALEDKGVSASDHDFADFAQDIEDIQTGTPFMEASVRQEAVTGITVTITAELEDNE